MTILEVQPGGGWWTEILAPYARATKGEFYATGADSPIPRFRRTQKGRADFDAKWADAAIYGKVNVVNWGAKAAPLPANKFDFVLLARGMHDWVRRGTAEPISPTSSTASSRAACSPSSSIAPSRARIRRCSTATWTRRT